MHYTLVLDKEVAAVAALTLSQDDAAVYTTGYKTTTVEAGSPTTHKKQGCDCLLACDALF